MKNITRVLIYNVAFIGVIGVTLHSSYAFSDLRPATEEYDAAIYFQQSGDLQGYSDGTFKPGAIMSRAEFLTFVFQVFNISPGQQYISEYADLNEQDWFASAIATARQQGLLHTNAIATSPITKGEVAKILISLAHIAPEVRNDLQDITSSDPIAPYMGAFLSNHIDVYPTLPFANPQGLVSRAEAVVMTKRALDQSNVALPTTAFASYLSELPEADRAQIQMITQALKGTVSILSTNNKDDREALEDSKPAFTGSSVSHGSGFFIEPNLVVTNGHLVSQSDRYYYLQSSDGTIYDVRERFSDPMFDLAFLRVSKRSNHRLALLPPTHSAHIGQPVFSIGNSLGKYPFSVSKGIISGITRSVTALGKNVSIELFDLLQTDANVSMGNSGGPLIDSNGQVVGMTTAYDQEGENIGLAIPASQIYASYQNFIREGKLTTPYLGVRYVNIDKQIADRYNLPLTHGALISPEGVEPAILSNSPAEKAGLRQNDIIVQVEQTNISGAIGLREALSLYRNQSQTTIRLYRNGQYLSMNVDIEQK